MTPLRVAIIGVGVIGGGVLRLAVRRAGLEVVAAIVRDAGLNGRAAREIVPEAPGGLTLSTDAAGTLQRTRPDVAIVATRSTLHEVLPQLRAAAAAGAAIACTAEDLAHIRPEDSAETAEIFALADRHQVAIVAIGLNPGFVLDLWPLALASLAHDVTAIEADRVVDLSGFGPRVRASLGIGYSPDAFEQELARGAISGHRGFPESLRLLGDALGRPVDETRVETRPIIAKAPRTLLGGELAAGQTAGVRQTAVGSSGGAEWLRLTMIASVALDELDEAPVDKVRIRGSTELSAAISPGTKAVAGTVGRIVNAIPAVAVAAPGVHTSLALGITPPSLRPR